MLFKRSTAIFFVFALLLPALFSYVFLTVNRIQIHKDVQMKIAQLSSEAKLIHFVFNEKDLELIAFEHSKEFKYKGRMYDIVSADTLGNNYHFYCIQDHKEAHLSEVAGYLTNKFFSQDSKNSNTEASIMSFFNNLFSDHHDIQLANVDNLEVMYIQVQDHLFYMMSLAPDSPPPELYT